MPISSTAPAAHPADPDRCTAPVLIVAHPGHELRILGWMGMAQPLTCVLTDGSGSRGEGRLSSTENVLERTGARAGPVFGQMSDKAVYAALLAGEHATFIRLADELAETLVSHGADCVVGDAIEGFNPSHDLCRLIINTAVRMASAGRQSTLPSYDYLLVGPPAQCPEHLRDAAFVLELSDQALDAKLEAARCYPELAAEVEAALAKYGLAPFRTECLRPSPPSERLGWDPAEVPYYERYGEERVASGLYQHVLRFRDHMLPAAEALWAHSERRG